MEGKETNFPPLAFPTFLDKKDGEENVSVICVRTLLQVPVFFQPS